MMLSRIRNFIFDLDGCTWHTGTPTPGAIDLISALQEAGLGVFFLTNSPGVPADVLFEQLVAAGIRARTGSVLGPLSVIAKHPLLADQPPTLVVGTDTVRDVLAKAGVPVVLDPDGAKAVVLGANPLMTYTDLAGAMEALDHGARFLALNLDMRLPVAHGVAVPGTGAIAAALTAATGVQPVVVGKPSAFFFREALKRFGILAAGAAMVGDSLDTDIAGGAGAGLLTVLVGDRTAPQRESIRPDIAVADLAELHRLLVPEGQ